MPKPKITTDYAKAVTLASKLVGLLNEKKEPPFDQQDLFPDIILPKGIKHPGARGHDSYLFYAVSLDPMRESRSVYKRARQMWEKTNFNIFPLWNKQQIKEFVEENFERAKPLESEKSDYERCPLWINLIKNNIEPSKKTERTPIGNPAEVFFENSRRLAIDYDNQPYKIRKGSISKTLKEICKFRGYGTPKASLFLKNMVRANMWEFPTGSIPIKIDRHAIRISLGQGVISVSGADEIRYDILVKHLEKIYTSVIKNRNLSGISLDDAFWAIGQYRCGQNSLTYCEHGCKLGCKIRPITDRQFTTINLARDCRSGPATLLES